MRNLWERQLRKPRASNASGWAFLAAIALMVAMGAKIVWIAVGSPARSAEAKR